MTDGNADDRTWSLDVLPGRFSVCRLDRDAPAPEPPRADLSAVIRSPGETTVLAPEGTEPAGARVEPGWRALRVRGPLEFGLTGVLAELAGTLAAAGVSLFAVSTFETDVLLVRDRDFDDACRALRDRGHDIVLGSPPRP